MMIRAVQELFRSKKLRYAMHVFVVLVMIGALVYFLAPQRAVGESAKQGAGTITPWAARLAPSAGPTADARPNNSQVLLSGKRLVRGKDLDFYVALTIDEWQELLSQPKATTEDLFKSFCATWGAKAIAGVLLFMFILFYIARKFPGLLDNEVFKDPISSAIVIDGILLFAAIVFFAIMKA